MKKHWLIITGFVALTVVVIIVANVFRSAETKPRQPGTVTERESNPEAEKLYQKALSQKESSEREPPSISNRIILDCCRKILKEYPDSVQAEKAEELLQEVPEQYREHYDREMSFLHLSKRKPKVKKSRTLRRYR